MSPKTKTGPQDSPKLSPKLSPGGERERAARRTREAEALRLNLLKRKAQARGRREAPQDDVAEAAPDPAGRRDG